MTEVEESSKKKNYHKNLEKNQPPTSCTLILLNDTALLVCNFVRHGRPRVWFTLVVPVWVKRIICPLYEVYKSVQTLLKVRSKACLRYAHMPNNPTHHTRRQHIVHTNIATPRENNLREHHQDLLLSSSWYRHKLFRCFKLHLQGFDLFLDLFVLHFRHLAYSVTQAQN